MAKLKVKKIKYLIVFQISEIVTAIKELGLVTVQGLFPMALCVFIAHKFNLANQNVLNTYKNFTETITNKYHTDHLELTKAVNTLSGKIENLISLIKM